MSESAPKRLLKKEKPQKPKGPVVAVVTLVAVVALLAGGYFGLCSWVRGNGLTLPGTTVSGLPGGQTVDISKLSSGDAAKLLSDKLANDRPHCHLRGPDRPAGRQQPSGGRPSGPCQQRADL